MGEEIHALAAEIFPICRSITGNGVRETLAVLRRHADIAVHEVPSGTQVFDWTVPREWNIRDAYVMNARGERVVDFRQNNLHVVSYSVPVHDWMPLAQLKRHIFTLPDQSDLIPYRTSYYAESWGFCMAHNALRKLPDGLYEVRIDSSLDPGGSLTYGEFFHQGETADEVLLTAHICHPSLANDNCSGLALLTRLAAELASRRTRLSYRLLFAPGTIGALAWLARNEDRIGRIRHGLVISGVGDAGGPTYKKSRRGDALVDRAMDHVLRHAGGGRVLDFIPYGYDERQFCSPAFDLPVGLLQRSQFGTFPQYHTSADNLDFIRPEHLAASYRMVVAAIDILENDGRPVNLAPKGEPQLGKRGLYAHLGGDKDGPVKSMAFLWVLNQADGRHSLLDIAE
ncbi:MAG TPA: DUF4910 domain-containing protein, partial [Magnetospirillum sp.]|nr:DUF4910 domain-containing protein [Magnetospirillum sp.]